MGTGSPGRIDSRRDWLAGWLLVAALAAVVGTVLWRYVGPLLFALFVYYAARPLVPPLVARIGSRSVAVGVVLLALAVPFAFLLVVAVSLGARQLQAVAPIAFADALAGLDVLVRVGTTGSMDALPAPIRERLVSVLANGEASELVSQALRLVGSLAADVFRLVLAGFATFYLLRDDYRLAAWFRRTVAGEGTIAYRFLVAVDRDLADVYRGNVLTVLVVMVVAAAVYYGLNLVSPAGVAIPNPALVGVLTGVATFVPLVGRSLVYGAVAILLALEAVRTDPRALWFPAALLVVGVGGLDTLVRYVLRPRLSAGRYHTGLMLFAYVLGAATFGWYGVFLGPLLLVVAGTTARYVLPQLLFGPDEPVPAGPDADPAADGPDGGAGPGTPGSRDGAAGPDSAGDGGVDDEASPSPLEPEGEPGESGSDAGAGPTSPSSGNGA
jgi:predicted PurR-regulated permease PerM